MPMRTKLAMLLVIKTPCITNCCLVMFSMPGLTVHSKNKVDNLNIQPVTKEKNLVVIISKPLKTPHPILSKISLFPLNPNAPTDHPILARVEYQLLDPDVSGLCACSSA